MEHIDGFILLHAPARGWKRLAASPSSLLFPSFVLWLPKSPEDLLSERERGTLRRRVLFNKTKYYHETNYLKARKFLFWRVTAAKLLQSCLTLCMLWTVACWAPLSMGFSRQEYWSGLPFLSLGVLPNPEIEPRSPALQADSLPSEPPRKPTEGFRQALNVYKYSHFPR